MTLFTLLITFLSLCGLVLIFGCIGCGIQYLYETIAGYINKIHTLQLDVNRLKEKVFGDDK